MYSYEVHKKDGKKMLVISLNPNTAPSQVLKTVGKNDYKENYKHSEVFARQNIDCKTENIFNCTSSSKATKSCFNKITQKGLFWMVFVYSGLRSKISNH